MISLTALWLPILLSAVFVFVASAIIHMTKLWHRNDYPRLPNEEGVRQALRPFAIPPGDYLLPRAYSGKEMRSAEYLQKVKEGPVLVMTVLPNREFSMGKNLLLWFIYTLIVSWFAAYVTSRVLPPGTEYLKVFQIAGATAFLGYAVALLQMSIWYQRSWALTVKALIDGLIYSLLAAGVFGWLWPQA